MSGRHILRLSFDLPPDADAELPERLRRLLEDFTPRVQLLEDGALLDLTGATRWWQRDARGITELVQLRVLAYFGVRSSAAVAGTPMLAAMACALTPLGRRTVIDDSPRRSRPSFGPGPCGNFLASAGRRPRCWASTDCTLSGTSPTSRSTLQRLPVPAPAAPSTSIACGRDTAVVDPPGPGEPQHGTPLPGRTRPGRPPAHPARPRRRPGARLRATDQIATGVTCTIRYAPT
ncbi:hypothetical protein O1M63_18720 [Streptomyces mirabilis]|nr:hypothetical protein [Streptomyces mirabilis]